MNADLLILGCGYTGRCVARRFLARGARVVATTRDPGTLADLAEAGVTVLPAEALPHLGPRLVLHSVPPAGGPDLAALGGVPSRVVCLSSTSVYGDQIEVDATTPVAPRTERERRRVEAEQAIAAGPWSSLILRSAAIYGPGRGGKIGRASCRERV